MHSKRMITDIHARMFADEHDWDEFRIADYEITDIMIEILGDGDNGELILSFANHPYEFPEIGQMLSRDPDIDFQPELTPHFDILEFLSPGLTRESPEADISQAWLSWKKAIRDGGSENAWHQKLWSSRAENYSVT